MQAKKDIEKADCDRRADEKSIQELSGDKASLKQKAEQVDTLQENPAAMEEIQQSTKAELEKTQAELKKTQAELDKDAEMQRW